jgi:hypothetical protein
MSWSHQIEADLKWREGEIASLKMIAATAEQGSDRQRAILRALWAMLYAHYEGFCKFCWDFLLEEIEKKSHKIGDLAEGIAILSMEKSFSDLKCDLSSDKIWSFFQNEFSTHLESKASLHRAAM